MSNNAINKLLTKAGCSFWAASDLTEVCCSVLCINKAKLQCPPRRTIPSSSLLGSPSVGPGLPSRGPASSALLRPLHWAALCTHSPSGWGDLVSFCLTQCRTHLEKRLVRGLVMASDAFSSVVVICLQALLFEEEVTVFSENVFFCLIIPEALQHVSSLSREGGGNFHGIVWILTSGSLFQFLT